MDDLRARGRLGSAVAGPSHPPAVRADDVDRGPRRRGFPDADDHRHMRHNVQRLRRPNALVEARGCKRGVNPIDVARPASRKPMMAVEAPVPGMPAQAVVP